MQKTRGDVLAARSAVGLALVTLGLLASLHLLSPEFPPAFRLVSEYAYGHYGWVLFLMFSCWGLSSLALAYALRTRVPGRLGKVGLSFLVVAGVGELLGGIFDINHDPGHSIGGFLGVGGFPVAAMTLSLVLRRVQPGVLTSALVWVAHVSWISVVLFLVTFVLLVVTFLNVAGALPAQAPKELPAGVVGLVGLADRLLVVVPCLWVALAAWLAGPRSERVVTAVAVA